MKEAIVEIEKIVYGGEGLGRLEKGKVVFVPYVVPQEKVKIGILEEYKDYVRAIPLEILFSSKERIISPCRYYGICGGCQFQHLNYPEELRIKEETLKELFVRQGFSRELPLKEVIPSEKIYHYRNRLRFHIENHLFKMGFVKKGTHTVVKIEECLLGEPLLNSVLKKLYENPTWIKLSLFCKRLKIESSPLEDLVSLFFWSSLILTPEEISELSQIPKVKSIFYLVKGSRPYGPYPEKAKEGGRRIFKALNNLIYYIQPGVFTQSNWDINLKIMEKILELGKEAKRVLDLHVGMGNFLFPLVKSLEEAEEFLGVDVDIRAIEDGIYTAEKNSLNGRLDLRRMSALECLYLALREGKKYDLLLLDPPRGGCKELIKIIPEVVEDKIIYISCDPPTLVRDIILLEKVGFILVELYLFDMFPRTYHFEVLALLQKKF